MDCAKSTIYYRSVYCTLLLGINVECGGDPENYLKAYLKGLYFDLDEKDEIKLIQPALLKTINASDLTAGNSYRNAIPSDEL